MGLETNINIKQRKVGHRSSCETKTIKLFKENTGENLQGLGFGAELLNMVPEVWHIKEQMKKQATGWERVFANHPPDKRLVLTVCKEFFKLKSKKNIFLMGKNVN